MKGAKQRVVFEPPGLFVDVRLERAGAIAAVVPLVGHKVFERGSKRAPFQRPHVLVFDASCEADGRQRFTIGRRERGFAAERFELGHLRNADVNRVDRHRADRRIRRLLARRHLVERQQLQNALSRAGEPGGERLDVADVADAPARG